MLLAAPSFNNALPTGIYHCIVIYEFSHITELYIYKFICQVLDKYSDLYIFYVYCIKYQLMALTFFEAKEDNGSGELLFLNEWLEENPKPKNKEFEVTEVKAVKSDKGYLVLTNDFQVFLWKKSKVTQMLLQAFDVWINVEPDTGFKLLVVLDLKLKDKYKLAVDKEVKVTWFTMGNGFTTSVDNAYSQESDLNPFL